MASNDDGAAILAKVNEGLTAPFERPLLLWLAAKIPPSVTPDHLTLLGVAGAFLAGAAYAATNFSPAFLWLANIGLLINWFGDSLDGTLARVRRQERPREGCFIDHTADLISQVAIGIGFGLSPYLRLDVGCLLLIGYLVLVAFTFIRATAFKILKLTYYGVGPTEIRLLLISAGVYFYFAGNWHIALGPLGLFTVADLVALAAFIGEMGFFLFSAYNDFQSLCGGWQAAAAAPHVQSRSEDPTVARNVSSPVK